MDWIKLKIAEAIGGKLPMSKKLLLAVGALVATVIFLINGVTSSASEKVALNTQMPEDQVVVKAATIYVHIVGEVNAPGIYQLDSGSRIVDVIFAAGGFTKLADQSSVNLAREVTDGEQVVVFKFGMAPQAIGGAAVGSAAVGGAARIRAGLAALDAGTPEQDGRARAGAGRQGPAALGARRAPGRVSRHQLQRAAPGTQRDPDCQPCGDVGYCAELPRYRGAQGGLVTGASRVGYMRFCGGGWAIRKDL